MPTLNYYLDKPDKKGHSPIYLRINSKQSQVKISIKKKVKKENFNQEKQQLDNTCEDHQEVNHYLQFLKVRAEDLFKQPKKTYTEQEIKQYLSDHVNNYQENTSVSIVKEDESLKGETFTFVDLFAGAGGFSEGLLQAEEQGKSFEFIAANDINENCELTHVVRYNHQLGLDAKFLCQDITEPDFLDNLLEQTAGKTIDVVCGGPPCQSFSLAGKRKKFDKKDDLFANYLKVIKELQPKYFVMENVKGILTKEKGKIKDLILHEMNSIVDVKEIPTLISFLKKNRNSNQQSSFLFNCLLKRVEFEKYKEKEKESFQEEYIRFVETKFRQITPKIVDYKTSKSDERVSTIRHGFNILIRQKQWESLKSQVIKEKDFCNIDNDYFVETFNQFLSDFSFEEVIRKIGDAFSQLDIPDAYKKDCEDIFESLKIYSSNFNEILAYLEKMCDSTQKKRFNEITELIRLYKIEKPFVANASNYGVPQNRERVFFIGCRKDQKFIEEIPHTVSEDERVSVFEALYDLDFIGNNEEAHHYHKVDLKTQYRGVSERMEEMIKLRNLDGSLISQKGKTYAEWSRDGRLIDKYSHVSKPLYVKDAASLQRGELFYDSLHNHKTSKQSEEVIQRLGIILREGSYKKAQESLEEVGLSSKKRNYNVLFPDEQSPTMMTIPDDYIHYNAPRALTVREMARLQSFDDSFVFQGKRSTGGNKRKSEVPQFTLVGNAVPPLMARAIGMEILRNIQ